eukprot:2101424-Heterocapsa_arctica.AAC.1
MRQCRTSRVWLQNRSKYSPRASPAACASAASSTAPSAASRAQCLSATWARAGLRVGSAVRRPHAGQANLE